jgi:hypothetical protein
MPRSCTSSSRRSRTAASRSSCPPDREDPSTEGEPKSVTSFQDLPLADRDREWDGDAAEKRVRSWAGAEDGPNEKYRDAHVWYDAEKKENFTAYKLLIADVVDGRLRAVPRGVMAAAAVMQGSRGGVDLPDKDRDRVRSHLAKYYAKMAAYPPWVRDDGCAVAGQGRRPRSRRPCSSCCLPRRRGSEHGATAGDAEHRARDVARVGR